MSEQDDKTHDALAQCREGQGGGGRPGSASEVSDRPVPVPVVRVRVGRVPRPADCFQHREAEDRLDEAAARSGTVVLCHVVAGMGGVGKTQLAASYATRVWDAGEVEVLVWVTAASGPQIVDAYARAAGRVVPDIDPADPKGAAVRFLEWAAETSQRWLVVLDDVRQPGDLAGWWPPDRPNGRVLVTTGDRSAAWNDQRRALDIGPFAPAEARAYLKAELEDHPCEGTDAHLDALAADLGWLPLALAQAAAFLRHTGLTIPAYRVLFAEQLLRNATPEATNLPYDQQQILAALWDLSVDQADRAHPVGFARPVLHLTSVLDPNGIPSAVLISQPACGYLNTYLRWDSETEVTAQSVVRALRVLHRFNLIDHDPDATHQEVRIHELIQRATRETLTDLDLRAALAFAAADGLIDVWPGIERDQLGTLLRTNATTLRAVTGPVLWRDLAHPVLFKVANSLGALGQVTEAFIECIQLHQLGHRVLGPDHPTTLTVRRQLAFWQGEAGDPAGAVAIFEEVLADRLRVLGPDHWDTLITRDSLATWRGKAGDPAGAAATFEELLAEFLRVLGPDHPSTWATRRTLAFWQREAGDPAGAAATYEVVLANHLRGLGPDHPNTLNTRGIIEAWRGEAGDPAGAAAAFKELLADYLRVLGPDHSDTLATRGNLATWQGKAGDPAGAAATFEELLADYLRILGPDHPYTLTVRNNLATWRGRVEKL